MNAVKYIAGIFALVIVCWAVAHTQENSLGIKAAEEIELLRAEKARALAEEQFYRQQLKKLNEKPKTLFRNMAENPAAVLGVLGALIAALVTLVSFIYNYRATLKNQRDIQFYEALKRGGDKDSAMIRVGAAGILLEMGRFNSLP